MIDGNEECDDGNDIPGDGCTDCRPSLSIEWLRTFGESPLPEAAFGVAARPGEIAVAGALASDADDTDVWIEVLDEAGVTQGRHLVGGTANDGTVEVRYGPEGVIWAAGVLDDGGATQAQIDVRRLTPALEVDVTATFGVDAQPDRATGLGVVAGGVVVGGVLGSAFANDAWFGRYDDEGTLVDSYTCDCGAFGGALDLATTATSARAVVIDGLEHELWGFDDGLGTGPSWRTTLDFTEPFAVLDVSATGDVIVCGGLGGANDIRVWLARFDSTGDEVWSITHDLGDGDHACQDVAIAPMRTVVVGSIRQDEDEAHGFVARFDTDTGELIDAADIVVDGSSDTRVLAVDVLGGVPIIAGTFAVDALDDDAFAARLVP
jgi:hypothetical protein